MLDPNNLYESGSIASGLLTRELRNTAVDGEPLILKLCRAIKAVATANGTIADVVTAADTLVTQFGTPATVNKVVAPY